MKWVKLTTLEARLIEGALIEEESIGEAITVLRAAMQNPIEEEIPNGEHSNISTERD